MTFQNQSLRATLTGGLFAAVLLGLSLPFAASSAEMVREGALYPSEPIAVGNFGTDIALFDNTVGVGNWIQERADVYRRVGRFWSEQHKFVNNGGRVLYGNAVAVHGDWMAIDLSVVFQSGGAAVDLTFYGVPGQPYLLQRSETLNLPNWITLQTLTAGAGNGKVSYTDANPPVGGAFYRIIAP